MIEAENSVEKRRRSISRNENIFYEMTGKMSAAGRLGTHKYENPELQDFTHRTYHVAEDIRDPRRKIISKTGEKLNRLELAAINK